MTSSDLTTTGLCVLRSAVEAPVAAAALHDVKQSLEEMLRLPGRAYDNRHFLRYIPAKAAAAGSNSFMQIRTTNSAKNQNEEHAGKISAVISYLRNKGECTFQAAVPTGIFKLGHSWKFISRSFFGVGLAPWKI